MNKYANRTLGEMAGLNTNDPESAFNLNKNIENMLVDWARKDGESREDALKRVERHFTHLPRCEAIQ